MAAVPLVAAYQAGIFDMPYATIVYDKRGHIARLTLNRPEMDNAIDERLSWELGEACQQINQDEDIRVVIITGAGDRAFCSGSDEDVPAVASAVAGIDRPVIAAINGDALGQGLELALSCDIRIASARARFGLPHTALGLIPTNGGTQRLPRIVAKGKALEMILTAEPIDAGEAYRIGLVNKVVPHQDLIPEAEEFAQRIAAKGPIALRYAKEAVNKGLDLTLEQGLRLEADLYFLLHTTEDRTDGIRAFQEKRPPQFKGR